jgi:hypothetical protein
MLGDSMQSIPENSKFDINSIVKYAIGNFLPKTAESHDADLVARLCVMAAVPTGEENPHDLLRSMSDDVIFSFVSNLEIAQKNPVSAPVIQFFFMEWCWRQGHLNADWKWEWDAMNEGHVSYSSKEPLENLFLKAKQC